MGPILATKHAQMRGEPHTWGSDAQGRYLAGGTCKDCFDQLIGKYVGAPPGVGPSSPSDVPARTAAIAHLHEVFDEHICDEDRLKSAGSAPRTVDLPWQGEHPYTPKSRKNRRH